MTLLSRRSRQKEENVLIRSESLIKAWRLNYAVLGGDRARATDAVVEAMRRTLTYQNKRQYALPTRRKVRNKPILDSEMLFQHFALLATNETEMDQEQEHLAGSLSIPEETMVLRYIKNLLSRAWDTRSFTMSVALCRLLYDYPHKQTYRIYHTLIQERGPTKADEQFRQKRSELLSALKARFGLFLDTYKMGNEHERFHLRSNQREMVEYVRKCLELFVPWGASTCVLPDQWMTANHIPEFIFDEEAQNAKADHESPIEKRRVYSLIHPICFARLTSLLGYASPDESLAVPLFTMRHNRTHGDARGNGGANHNHKKENTMAAVDLENLPMPDSADLQRIIDGILEDRARRRGCSPTVLTIFVDGKERPEKWDITESGRMRFAVQPEADLVELVAKDSGPGTLLSVISLKYTGVTELGKKWRSSVRLEGGQRIGMRFFPTLNEGREIVGTECLMSYHETQVRRAFSLLWRRLENRKNQLALPRAYDWFAALIALKHLPHPNRATIVGAVIFGLTTVLFLQVKASSVNYQEAERARQAEIAAHRQYDRLNEKLRVVKNEYNMLKNHVIYIGDLGSVSISGEHRLKERLDSGKQGNVGEEVQIDQDATQVEAIVRRLAARAGHKRPGVDPTQPELPSGLPVEGEVKQKFGELLRPDEEAGKAQDGIRISVCFKAHIKATAPGIVLWDAPLSEYGQLIIIYHGNGVASWYGHMDPRVKPLQRVARGDVIGEARKDGRSDTTYIYYGIRKNDQPIDPLNAESLKEQPEQMANSLDTISRIGRSALGERMPRR